MHGQNVATAVRPIRTAARLKRIMIAVPASSGLRKIQASISDMIVGITEHWMLTCLLFHAYRTRHRSSLIEGLVAAELGIDVMEVRRQTRLGPCEPLKFLLFG